MNEQQGVRPTERMTYRDSTYSIVSKVAYLIGVPKRIFENQHEPPQLEIFQQLENDNLRFKIIHNDFVYVCDCIDEDGIITLLNLLHEVEAIKIDVDIYEQSENGERKVTPFLLQNLLEQYKEIAHQIQEIVDLEAED